MKIKSSLFAAIFASIFFAAAAYGQEPMMTGGYANADVTDAEIVKAAKYAVKKRSGQQKTTVNLTEIKSAQQQVVAGLNYRLCMLVSFKDKKTKKTVRQSVRAVVFRSLKNSYSLTSWREEKCSDSEISN